MRKFNLNFNSMFRKTPSSQQTQDSPGFREFAKSHGLDLSQSPTQQQTTYNAAGTPVHRSAEQVQQRLDFLTGKYERKYGPKFLDQAKDAARVDFENTAAAQELRQERIRQNLDPARESVQGFREEVSKYNLQEADRLDALSEEQRQSFEDAASAALENFDEQGLAIQSAQNAGIRQSYRNTVQALKAGFSPDGTTLTPAQSQAMMQEYRVQAENQVTSRLAEIGQRLNETRLQAEIGLNQQRLGSFQTQNQLAAQAAQLRTAVPLVAFQNELQGYMALAEYEARNPDTPITMFDSLMALGSLATAPGGRNLEAV